MERAKKGGGIGRPYIVRNIPTYDVLSEENLAARGIDIQFLPLVINYELPRSPKDYVHRIGRTGRAGADGSSISFVDGLDLINLKSTEKLIGKKIPVVEDHPYPFKGILSEKAGELAKKKPKQGQRRRY